MMIYDNEFESNGFTFNGGLVTTRSVLGICLNLEDEKIIELIDNPELLSTCLKEIIPEIMFNEAHRHMCEIADDNGYRGQFYHQWEEYFADMSYTEQTKLKKQAELVLDWDDCCQPRAVNNAKIVLECLKGNFPPRYYKEKTPEEKARASFDRKKPKIRLKLVIRDGYKCDNCGKDQEDSLCVIQKEVHNTNYELDNLTLRCRSCMNKMKKK